jgi:glycosyltransferase involved in cell wall biosynthesis
VVRLGHEIHLISSYACDQPLGVYEMHTIPLAGAGVVKPGTPENPARISRTTVQRFRRSLLHLRYYLGPISVMRASSHYQGLIDSIQPDLVHALRIPFEGMLASYTPSRYRVIISTWGNDFTLHASRSILMRNLTHAAVRRANGFMADCFRDIWLAKKWGLRREAPTQFAPGNGGLDLVHLEEILKEQPRFSVGSDVPVKVINPRGIRPTYVMNDSFFQAIPMVLREEPAVKFLGSAMKGQIDAEKWVQRLHLENSVTLLEPEPQEALWRHFLECQVLVSPAIHDGTPNSILEGMTLGCLPVVGDIDSLREWIENGRNGILVNPRDPKSIAEGIVEGIRNTILRQQALLINQEIIRERVDANKVRLTIRDFYHEVAHR